MAYIAVAVGVLWVSTLAFVFGICRASGRADRQEEAMLAPTAPVVPATPKLRPKPTPARSPRLRPAALARREAAPEITAGAGVRLHSS